MIPVNIRKRRPAILATSAAALLTVAFLGSAPKAGAQQFWDGPNANPAVTEGGSGIWDAVTANWTDATGTTNSIYDPALTSIFGVTGGTVDLGANLSFTNLTFQVPGYIITGGAGPFTLAPTGTGILNALTGAAGRIDAQLTGAGAIEIQGAGTGTITLTNAANDYNGGTMLASGTLLVDATGALGSGTLTITSVGGTPRLGTTVNGTTIANDISLEGNVLISTSGFAQDFFLDGNVDLNGATRTIVGVTDGGQVHFGPGGISSTGGPGGLTLSTTFGQTGEYVAFIFDGDNVNTYTGLTTVNTGAFLVLTGNTPNGAIQGDVLIQGNGVVDYLGGAGEQIADDATVTVNSNGSVISGGVNGTFAGLDFFNSTGETIGTLNGSGTVWLASATLTVGAGNFLGDIEDGTHVNGLNQPLIGGQIVKVGAGILVFSGTNSYTGPTTVNGGTFVNNGSTISRLIVSNGSDAFNNGLLTVGANVTAITAATGSTISNTGIVTGGAIGSTGVNLTGADNVFTNAAGATTTATTAVLLSNATGFNEVLNLGTLTGTGGTAISAVAGGAMSLLNAGAIEGNVLFGNADDTLRLATGQSSTGTFDGAGGANALRLVGTTSDALDLGTVTNFSTLNKLGGGSWSLTGTGAFAGGTTVTAGVLSVQGNLISNVFVMADGSLGGNGIITGSLTNFGIVNPGNSPGKLVIKGNYTQGRSGTLVIEMAGSKRGQFDVLEVSGRANLDGTLRLVRVGKGPRLKAGDRLEFLTAEGGVQGTFADVENPFDTDTIVKGEVVYEDNVVLLKGTQGSYEEFARNQGLTSNQRSVARVIDRAALGGEEAKLVTYLNERPLGELPGDFDRIAPEELTAVYRVSIALADIQARNIGRRLEEVRLSNRRPKPAAPTTGSGAAGPTGEVEKTILRTEPEDRWGAFFTGTGQVARVGRTENARGYDLNTGGLTIGVDYKVTPNFAVGVSAGYANTDAEVTNNGNIRINGGKIGAYATYFTGGFHADGAVSTGYNSYETRRTGLDGIARGRTDGVEVSALAGAGYDWKFEDFTIGPKASLQYAYVGIDEFTERGSLAPLRIPDQDVHSFSSTLGFASAYDWILGKVVVRPEVRAAWRHEFGDRSFALDSQLASGAGGIFTVQDSEVGSDSFLLGAGVSVIWSGGTIIYLSYDGELGRQEYDAHNLSGGVRLTF